MRITITYKKYFEKPTILKILLKEKAMPKIKKISNETLYKSKISDFFPTYLAPNGKQIMIPARYEKTRNHIKKSSDSPEVNAE